MSEEYTYFIVDDCVYFELKGRAGKDKTNAIVSCEMWRHVSKYKWYLGKAGYPICYSLGKITLHRFIYSFLYGEYPPSNLYVDHVDRNKLNNTNANLRLVTPQENSFNRSTQSDTKGVRKISEGNYSAVIMKDGNLHEIKNIATKKEAAEIYNIMAEDLFGVFAAKNNIDNIE